MPCLCSKDEKWETDLLVQKLQAMGLEVRWTMPAGRSARDNRQCVWAFLPGNVGVQPDCFWNTYGFNAADSRVKVSCTDGIALFWRNSALQAVMIKLLPCSGSCVLEAVRAVREQENLSRMAISSCVLIAEEIQFDRGGQSWSEGYRGWSRLLPGYRWCTGIVTNSAPRLCSIFILVKGKSALQVSSLRRKGINIPLCWRRKLANACRTSTMKKALNMRGTDRRRCCNSIVVANE